MKSKRIGEIEIWRFIFCIVIILYHCNTRIFMQLGRDDYSLAWSPRGYIGVEFFFMLSGYFMVSGIMKMQEAKQSRGALYVRYMWGKYISVFPYHIIAFMTIFIRQCIILKGFSLNLLLKNLPEMFLVQRMGFRYYNLNSVEWYLAAMLLAMAVILPLAMKFRDVYFKYLAPLSAILIYGWLIHENGKLGNIHVWTSAGFICVWRAVAGLNLGMFANQCVRALSKYDFSKKEQVTAHVIRFVLWGTVLVFAFLMYPKKYEVTLVLLMFLALVLTFVFTPKNSERLSSSFVMFLGKMSLPLYLNQMFVIKIVISLDLGLSEGWTVLVVLVSDFIISLPCYFGGNALLKLMKNSRLNKMIMGLEPTVKRQL
ncbi:MAG: acyltransferase [Eubacterium sp.]|nr:acyltransferase [Eubacterium sp.]